MLWPLFTDAKRQKVRTLKKSLWGHCPSGSNSLNGCKEKQNEIMKRRRKLRAIYARSMEGAVSSFFSHFLHKIQKTCAYKTCTDYL